MSLKIVRAFFWPYKGEKEQGVTLLRDVKITYFFH